LVVVLMIVVPSSGKAPPKIRAPYSYIMVTFFGDDIQNPNKTVSPSGYDEVFYDEHAGKSLTKSSTTAELVDYNTHTQYTYSLLQKTCKVLTYEANHTDTFDFIVSSKDSVNVGQTMFFGLLTDWWHLDAYNDFITKEGYLQGLFSMDLFVIGNVVVGQFTIFDGTETKGNKTEKIYERFWNTYTAWRTSPLPPATFAIPDYCKSK